jgi:hypothetical protein
MAVGTPSALRSMVVVRRFSSTIELSRSFASY